MPQTKLLLDTNAYLRLAYTIHPLLFVTFGEENYTLLISVSYNTRRTTIKIPEK